MMFDHAQLYCVCVAGGVYTYAAKLLIFYFPL